jgi:hypothetical protein
MLQEKRKEHRLRASLAISIIHGHEEVIGQTSNISRLGTYVEIDKRIPAGAVVELTLDLPVYSRNISQSGQIRCKGTVFRSNLTRESAGAKFYGIGIFFTEFASKSDAEKLSQYVDFLILSEEQEVREGLKRRREKEEEQKLIRQSEEVLAHQEKFVKESLGLLRQISSRLEDIYRMLQSADKNK